MAEVKDLINLFVSRNETLNASQEKIKILLLGPSLSFRSSFKHVLRNVLWYFLQSENSSKYDVTFYRTVVDEKDNDNDSKYTNTGIKLAKGTLTELASYTESFNPKLMFIIDDIEVSSTVVNTLTEKGLVSNLHIWQYFRPREGFITNAVADWLTKKVDRVFIPSEYFEKDLQSVLSRKLEVLRFPAPTEYFPLERKMIERALEIPEASARWLCPDRFNEQSQIDTVLIAFANYVTQNDNTKKEQILLLGDINEQNSFPVMDIFNNELIQLGKDPKDYVSNIVLLKSEAVRQLTDSQLNGFYNACDYVISTRYFSSNSFSYLHLASLGLPMLLPNHSWFHQFAEKYQNITLVPISYRQYRTNGIFGLKMLVDPAVLKKMMSELREKSPEIKKWDNQPEANFSRIMDKRLTILSLE